MALGVEIKYLEGKKFEVRSLKSGVKVCIDSPRQGYIPEGLSSSELFLASIGGCIMYYAHTYLTHTNIDFKKLEVMVSGEWQKIPILTIKDIKVKISTDAQLDQRKESFLRFVHNCPVHNTIINTRHIDIGLER